LNHVTDHCRTAIAQSDARTTVGFGDLIVLFAGDLTCRFSRPVTIRSSNGFAHFQRNFAPRFVSAISGGTADSGSPSSINFGANRQPRLMPAAPWVVSLFWAAQYPE
jgi:hypothetical protein